MKTPLPTEKGLAVPRPLSSRDQGRGAVAQLWGCRAPGSAPAAISSPGSPSAGWARAGSPPPCLLPSPPRRPAPLTPSRQTFSSLRAMVGQAAPSPSAGDAAQNDHSPFPARQTDTRTDTRTARHQRGQPPAPRPSATGGSPPSAAAARPPFWAARPPSPDCSPGGAAALLLPLRRGTGGV